MAGHNVNVCDIPPPVIKALEDFKISQNQKFICDAAMIIKVNREKQILEVEEELFNVEIEDIRNALPSHQPRFIIYNFRMIHNDGRISFPLCFIFYTPRDSQMELQVMYAGTQRALAAAAGVSRLLEVRELEDLNAEWIQSKLKK